MSTMRDVAELAGVSVKTVSRVFNEDPHVLPQTRRRVTDALARLNYTPNMLARTFRAGRSPVVGVAVPDISDPFFSAVAKGVEGVAAAYDMSVIVSSLGDDPGKEQDVLELMLSRQLGALVLAPVSDRQQYLERWTEKLPVVFVDRPPRGIAADCFVDDDLGGARAAVEHLIGHGHTAVGFVGNSLRVPTSRNRLRGYRSALAAAGVPFREELVVTGAATPTGAWRAVDQLASASTPPTAIFSSDAQTTILLVPALAGRRWAVAAFGDFPMAAMLSPSLTVVDQDPDALGRLAAERAIRRLLGEVAGPPRRTTLPVRLLERESCRSADPAVELFPRSLPGGGGDVVWRSTSSPRSRE